MKIGNWVSYNFDKWFGDGYCLGEMAYSTEKGRVILIATDDHLGMPIALRHCRVQQEGDVRAALLLRKRYEAKLPGHLKELKKKTA